MLHIRSLLHSFCRAICKTVQTLNTKNESQQILGVFCTADRTVCVNELVQSVCTVSALQKDMSLKSNLLHHADEMTYRHSIPERTGSQELNEQIVSAQR